MTEREKRRLLFSQAFHHAASYDRGNTRRDRESAVIAAARALFDGKWGEITGDNPRMTRVEWDRLIALRDALGTLTD